MTEWTWTNYQGRTQKLTDLEDTHLANIIRWVMIYFEHYDPELIVALGLEAERRGFTDGFFERAEIPYRDKDGHWTVNFKRVVF